MRSSRWIGVLTLGGLIALLVGILRRLGYLPIDPERLFDTRPATPSPSPPGQPPGPGDPESVEPMLSPESAPDAHGVVPS